MVLRFPNSNSASAADLYLGERLNARDMPRYGRRLAAG